MTLLASKLREAGIRIFHITHKGRPDLQSVQADSYQHTGGTYDFYKGSRMVFSISEKYVENVTEGKL